MTLKDLQTEVARELVMRNKKYPEWIQSGFLNKDVANRQFERLKAVSLLLGAMTEREYQDLLKRATDPKKNEPTPDLFSAAAPTSG